VGLFIVLAVDACRNRRDLWAGCWRWRVQDRAARRTAASTVSPNAAIAAAALAPGEMLLLAMGLFAALLALNSRLNAPTARPDAAHA
jgi:hypothetical protein